MVEKIKYFKRRDGTGLDRYILADIPYDYRKHALACAKGMRGSGGKAKVVQDKKTGKWLCYSKQI